MDLRKKYLIKAPLMFKMNPPPRIVDLTSDFFENEHDRRLSDNASSDRPKKVINNNPKAN